MQGANTTTQIVSAELDSRLESKLICLPVFRKLHFSLLNPARNPGLGWPGGQRG